MKQQLRLYLFSVLLIFAAIQILPLGGAPTPENEQQKREHKISTQEKERRHRAAVNKKCQTHCKLGEKCCVLPPTNGDEPTVYCSPECNDGQEVI
jgi:hypothetical protein